MFTKLDDDIFVSPQITIDQVANAKNMGITMIINNRPDGESADQTEGDAIKLAAMKAELEYISIPITHAGFSAPQVEAMVNALTKNSDQGGKILAYCRSGTRSTFLWSLAQAKMGMSPNEISRLSGNAGYDTTPVRALIEALAGQTGS